MTEIVEIEGYVDDREKVVVLGDERAANKISFQLAQDFYNEITGKSERLKELSNESFILKLSDIEQLYHRLKQSTEQYNIVSFHESYIVSYVDDSSERYSSFERLQLHNGAKGAAVEEFIASFNILIVLPQTHRAQEYKITVKLASRVARIEGMRNQMGSMPFDIPLCHLEGANVAVFSIEYVDSTVATALMSVLKSWFNTVEKNSISSSIKTIRKYSHLAPRLTKYGLLFTTCYLGWDLSSVLLAENVDTRVAVLFVLGSFLSAYISINFGHFLGRKTEVALDSIYEQSYINFSGADDNFIKNSSCRIRSSKIKAALNMIVTIVVGVGCSLVASWLYT
ncbi:hypothetical protein [Photobacterium leiognathi]|uniref:hypothetical protein n=1 Tax=Photobacterium leiognathi TaxID=553611 RepID=UPI00273A1218|nr:hypothetical protein [Photobacterium leiognathi]